MIPNPQNPESPRDGIISGYNCNDCRHLWNQQAISCPCCGGTNVDGGPPKPGQNSETPSASLSEAKGPESSSPEPKFCSACGSKLGHAPGIGPCCGNRECEVNDGPFPAAAPGAPQGGGDRLPKRITVHVENGVIVDYNPKGWDNEPLEAESIVFKEEITGRALAATPRSQEEGPSPWTPPKKDCDLCRGTGFYGDRGPGRTGNSEFIHCDCTTQAPEEASAAPAPEPQSPRKGWTWIAGHWLRWWPGGSATAWPNGTWHTFDSDGGGGENASDPTVGEAMDEAEKAIKRQGFDQETEDEEEPQAPAPASPAGRERLIGLLLRYNGIPNAGPQDPYYRDAAKFVDRFLAEPEAGASANTQGEAHG